ncbi:MAG: hypothetical protein ACXU8A_00140 [Burkholderiaceae bacterium]
MSRHKYPRGNTAGIRIAKALFNHGAPVTLEEGIELHGYPTTDKRWAAQTVYNDMVNAGYLTVTDGKYKLAEYLRKHYCDLTATPFSPSEDLVQKRTNLSRGEMPVQKRDPRIRPDIFFKTVGGV